MFPVWLGVVQTQVCVYLDSNLNVASQAYSPQNMVSFFLAQKDNCKKQEFRKKNTTCSGLLYPFLNLSLWEELIIPHICHMNIQLSLQHREGTLF